MDLLNVDVKKLKSYKHIDINSNEPLHISSFIVIPCDYCHQSGYRCMEYLLLDKHREPIGIIGGGCDALEVAPKLTGDIGKAVRMDMLPCGLLQVWVNADMTVPWSPLSDFFVYYQEKTKEER